MVLIAGSSIAFCFFGEVRSARIRFPEWQARLDLRELLLSVVEDHDLPGARIRLLTLQVLMLRVALL